MYRRPKFLEVLLEIRQEMARQADYDVDLFAEMVRSGSFSGTPAVLGPNDPGDGANRRRPGAENGRKHS